MTQSTQQLPTFPVEGIALATTTTTSLNCQNCKLKLDIRQQPTSVTLCPYCGSSDLSVETSSPEDAAANGDAAASSPPSTSFGGHHRRSASPRLPQVRSKHNSTSEDGAIESLLMSSLTSLTLGRSFRLGLHKSQDKLPNLATSTSTSTSTSAERPGRKKSHSFSQGSLSAEEEAKKEKEEKQRLACLDLTKAKFEAILAEAKDKKDFDKVKETYAMAFCSYENLCATFKVREKDKDRSPQDKERAEMEEPGLDLALLRALLDTLKTLDVSVQKVVIKAIVQCLLNEKSELAHRDHARCLFILIQNPLFASQSTYTILAHLLQQVTRLSSSDHQYLVRWFRSGLSANRMRAIVRVILQLITIRQFPPADKSLPPASKSKWWIPTAIKVLALLNAANNLPGAGAGAGAGAKTGALIEYSEFYNIALDHMDLMQEYYTWQNPERTNQFSYCQYPFILSLVAKQHILTKDSEQQMILTARRSLVQKMARQKQPQIDIFFLNIAVRREHLVQDSLKEISAKQKNLKKKLKISFIGEPGLDMGGLTKEWFQLLVRQIFDPENGLFVYHAHSRCYWFSLGKNGDGGGGGSLREYNLIGVLMGLAVYNSIILDLHFPSICYQKLLTPPVVPAGATPKVGVVKKPSLDDLAEIMPDVARSLRSVLDYSGDVAEDFLLTFQVSVEEQGKGVTEDLCPDGQNKLVDNDNRQEFVNSYLHWVLNSVVEERFRAFYLGFHSVCASNALIMLRPEEVEQLVCGSQSFDLAELKKVTLYDGYKDEDVTIQHFWEVLEDYSLDLQKKFLLFTTGSDRVPVAGTSELTVKVSRLKGVDKLHHLPVAHTCFNQICIPDYQDKETLKLKLTIAISNAEGFGLE